MSTLAALLKCLERTDVSEVRLQSDAAVTAVMGNSMAPLTKAPLSSEQIVHIASGTALAGVLASVGDLRTELPLALAGQDYAVSVNRIGTRIQVRVVRSQAHPMPPPVPIARAPAAAAVGGAATPAAVKAAPAVAHAAAAAVPTQQGASQPDVAVRAVSVAAPDWLAGTAPLSQSHVAAQPTEALLAMLREARRQKASDLHISTGSAPRTRQLAQLVASGEVLDAGRVEALLQGLLSPRQQAALASVGYADFAIDLRGVGRARVNVSRQALGLKACFRLIPADIPTLAELGLPPELQQVAKYHQGLAVISGPQGAGKTTTMAAIVDHINRNSAHHIITVEDPIELIHPIHRALMSQREVGNHTRSFARALKAALREDPDVIVIGELRDRETVEIALSAAETGHLVIATMSTRSGAKTIDRLIDMFPPEDQSQVRATLAGALKIIVSQRLLLGAHGDALVAVAELLTGSVPLWNLIRDNKLFQLPSLQARGRGLGMIRLDTSLQELVQAGKITEVVAMAAAETPLELERSLHPATAANPSRRS